MAKNLGWYKRGRFCKENNLFSAPEQLRCFTGILTEPKKALLVLCFSCTLSLHYFFLLEAIFKGSGNGCVLLMDLGTGRSGEGVFPPVPQQVQAGFEVQAAPPHIL